jgi:putative DNA primase/helicase
MKHLGTEAAAPLTALELAKLTQLRNDDSECIMPVLPDAGPVPVNSKLGRKADRQFEYRAADGGLLGYVLRWDARDGRRKEFWPATYWRDANNKGSWRFKAWPSPRPLFGLDRLAAYPDAIVLLTEGEKAAEAVEHGPLADAFTGAGQGVIGVSWPGGAEAIKYADLAPLAGREVIIVPDNDAAGEKAADQLVEMLHQTGVRRLRRWRPPKHCQAKWDIADAIPAELTPETLVKSILEASEIAPSRVLKTLSEFLSESPSGDFRPDCRVF